jgi:hypothetical protein
VNAAAYVYYAQEAGMTRTNYLKATGSAVSSNGVKDINRSCMHYIKIVGKGCCKNAKAGFYGYGWKKTPMYNKSLRS